MHCFYCGKEVEKYVTLFYRNKCTKIMRFELCYECHDAHKGARCSIYKTLTDKRCLCCCKEVDDMKWNAMLTRREFVDGVETNVPFVHALGCSKACFIRNGELFLRANINENGKLCPGCGKRYKKLKKCSGCKLVSYCSVECQRVNWEKHRVICLAIAEE